MKLRRFISALICAGLLASGLGVFAFGASAAPDLRPRAALSDNLIAYWQLEEASGTRLDQLNGCGGSGCDLTDNNTVTSNPGKVGNAAQLTKVNGEWLSRADHADLSVGNIDFYFSGWVYFDTLPSAGADTTIFGKYVAGTNTEYILTAYRPSTTTYFYWSVTKADNSGSVDVQAATFGGLSAGAWYFFEVKHDATADVVGIAINGGAFDTAALVGGGRDGGAPLEIGRYNISHFLDGRIDELGFWKRIPNTTERGWLWNSGAGCTYPFTACEPTPTPTPTNTFTPSNTPTSTLTPTPTFTSTPTDTPTASDTPTSTSTPTLTPTGTLTPTDTPTPTITPTVTLTPTPSDTPTITPTPTETLPPTATETPSPTATATATYTPTPPWIFEITLPAPVLGTVVRIERRWTWGEEAIFFVVLALIAVVALRWIYDVVRAEVVKPVSPHVD